MPALSDAGSAFISGDVSPDILRPLLPWRGQLTACWQHIVAGLAQAPDPSLAAVNLSRLVEHGCGTGAVLQSAELSRDLLFLLGASQHLSHVLVQQGQDWEAVFLTDRSAAERSTASHLQACRPALPCDLAEDDFLYGLRAYRNREYLRIGTRDLLARASLEETTRDLSALADAAVQIAYEYTRARMERDYGVAWVEEAGEKRPIAFVVFGMGKLGGEELNFSSDIDLIYLYECDAGLTTGGRKGQVDPRTYFTELAQHLTQALSTSGAGGFVFRVDLRLRPDGTNGQIVNSLANTLLYYEAWGQTWERLALLKTRPIAGEQALGERFLREVAPFILRRYLDFTTVEDTKALKMRIERSLHRADRGRLNVKLGRGGIREIEFVTQVLQLIHAGKDPRVLGRNTLAVLDRLVEGAYLAASDRDALAAAYRFLRQVEHKIQMVHDRQTHTLPGSENGLRALARRLRVADRTEVAQDALAVFLTALREHTQAVHTIFRSLFHIPEGSSEADVSAEQAAIEALFDELHDPERTQQRLEQLGFRDLTHTYERLRLLHDGPAYAPAPPRRRELLYALAPTLFHEVCRSADPDRALASVADLIASIGARSSFLSLLRENPHTLRTLIGLFGTSSYLSRIFLRRPEFLDSLVRADLVHLYKSQELMQDELMARITGAPELEDRLDILREYRHEEFLRIGINDTNGQLDFPSVSVQLSYLAEACLHGAYETARAALLEKLGRTDLPGRIVIVGMGKLGARELNYNSDLDLIFLYEPHSSSAAGQDGADLVAQEVFAKLVQRLISVLQVQTREGAAYKIDTRLRPSGRAGSLVSSVAAFTRYHQTQAQLWERQALIKARAVAGDSALAARVNALFEDYVYSEPIRAADVAEIQRLRGRMELELAAETNERFNIKTGRGGLVDVEFLVQMLQLRYGHRLPAVRHRDTLSTLDALRACRVLSREESQVLKRGYQFLRRLENRLRIERDQPVEALERNAEQLTSLARRMGYEGAEAGARVLAEYHRQREAIRACYSRLFEREQGDSHEGPVGTITS